LHHAKRAYFVSTQLPGNAAQAQESFKGPHLNNIQEQLFPSLKEIEWLRVKTRKVGRIHTIESLHFSFILR
jgi:hypothetical protein